ncbi:hypothetical protein GW17_00044423 [Ensete ventricosum]|nr:hypothetical protein GW17_00044423 [Ensete ventricosum]
MVVEETDTAAVVDPSKSSKGGKQPRRGVVSRLWRGIFGADDDYQKKLEHLSKEEASVHARLKRRAKSSRKMTRNIIVSSVILERYDLDPAAKAAAATVLACKLGADSGLKVHVGDESTLSTLGKSNDVELVQSSGLHNRKSMHRRGNSTGSSTTSQIMDKSLNEYDADTHEIGSPDQRVVEHFRGSAFDDGGWLARIAALLVGEDPTQCYALICAHCHMHNGVHSKNNADSFTGNAVVSSLATVEEIPGGGTDENVIDKHDSGSPASAQRDSGGG